MKQFLLIFIFILPNIAFASFPIEVALNDTIRKNGKIYILIKESENSSFNKTSSNINIQSTVEKKKKPKKRSQRSKGILTSLGFLLVILAVLVAIAVGLFFDLLLSL